MNNPKQTLINYLNNGGNAEQLVQQLVQRQPQLQQTITQFRNMSQGQNMRDFTMQYLKQNGANLQEVEEMARMMGLK